MQVCRLAIAVLLFLVASSLSQDNSGVDQRSAVPRVQKILSSAQLSGSLEYWGFCDGRKTSAEFPSLRSVAGRDGSARDVLRDMFADDTKMKVTQDSDGKIRMAETDVPKDLLEVKIHYLSFPPDYHGPKMAVMAILQTQEVIHFITERNVVPQGGWGLPGDDSIAIKKPSVPGELKDVTVKQALDYVLQTFPGFWTYQNCYDQEGRRKISVGFIQHLPPVSDAPLPQTE
jgi:hypothetical protein